MFKVHKTDSLLELEILTFYHRAHPLMTSSLTGLLKSRDSGRISLFFKFFFRVGLTSTRPIKSISFAGQQQMVLRLPAGAKNSCPPPPPLLRKQTYQENQPNQTKERRKAGAEKETDNKGIT